MSNESSKTRALFTDDELSLLSGDGLDIGCGTDPINENCQCFDLNDGDANSITEFIKRKFDYVYSSHCLEHMINPEDALFEWWSLVKDGGALFLIVPDEDLYEQGVFPSIYNSDHKWTFTISKNRSWSKKSINLFDLLKSLPHAKIKKIELQDNNYDRSAPAAISLLHSKSITRILGIYRILRYFGIKSKALNSMIRTIETPMDQTKCPDVLAQIFCVVQKDIK